MIFVVMNVSEVYFSFWSINRTKLCHGAQFLGAQKLSHVTLSYSL